MLPTLSVVCTLLLYVFKIGILYSNSYRVNIDNMAFQVEIKITTAL